MKLEKHKNLWEECRFYWREIDDGTLNFDRVNIEVHLFSDVISVPSYKIKCLPSDSWKSLTSGGFTGQVCGSMGGGGEP